MGRYYNITDENQLIDVVTINNGTGIISTAAQKFGKCADLMLNASDICNANALSVDKTTIQPKLGADAEYIRSIQTKLTDLASQINNLALQVYSEQKLELQNYWLEQERLRKLEEEKQKESEESESN